MRNFPNQGNIRTSHNRVVVGKNCLTAARYQLISRPHYPSAEIEKSGFWREGRALLTIFYGQNET
jgi:hypothetical protein